MPKLKEVKVLPYSAEQIYELVMDIEKYPQFLPWCKNARIIKRIDENNLYAELTVKFGMWRESYTSKVYHQRNLVEAQAISGPFKKLLNRWIISEINKNSCEIEFSIDFEFRSPLLQKAIQVMFQLATEKMISAFEQRARYLFSSQPFN